MRIDPIYRTGGGRCIDRRRPVLAAVLLCLALAGRAGAQPEVIATAEPQVPKKPQAPLEPLPVKDSRTPPDVAKFMEPLTTNDGVFELTLGQSRVLTIKSDAKGFGVGDPSVVDFNVISPRQYRLVGMRLGVTDVSFITADQVYNFEIRVVADLEPLRLQIRATFPDAQIKLTATRGDVVVEGQARDAPQVARIMEAIRGYLDSIYATELRRIKRDQQAPPGGGFRPLPPPGGGQPPMPIPGPSDVGPPLAAVVSPELGSPATIEATVVRPRLINLIKVPGPQQVLLKVRIAELNRTALRQIGADFLGIDPKNGAIIGTQIGGATVVASGTAAGLRLVGAGTTAASNQTTVFGIFQRGDFEIMLSALRRNSIVKLLAEPNLMAMNGHQASFLAGGKFPVPIPQSVTGGVGTSVAVQFEKFGVELDFLPFILDDERIRLSVHPQVSSIDFSIGTTLVPGGSPVPGLNSREAKTTVELRQGQTLAIAGLLQLTLDGSTSRIPGLGDLPVLGPFFSNTSETRTEKELIVLVTPYLVDAMNPDQVPPTPGDEVKEPNDLEFYLLNRIEGRTGRDFRSTVKYDDATGVLRCLFKLEKEHVRGPHGFCDD
jgi:pilus assembly protein CpaC